MNLLLDGLKLMVTGMGMVFLFLFIMILWIQLSSKVSARFSHLLPETPAVKPQRRREEPAAPASALGDPLLPAVIAAAIHHYRRDRA